MVCATSRKLSIFCREFEHTSFEIVGSIVEARGGGDESNKDRKEWTRKKVPACIDQQGKVQMDIKTRTQVSKQRGLFLLYRQLKDVTRPDNIIPL